MNSSPLVGIVLVEYKNRSFTNNCIQSILDNEYGNYIIILVDNTPGNAVFDTSSLGGKIQYLPLAENRGFCEACNAGTDKALSLKADYIWILNNDTRLKNNTLAALVQRAGALEEFGILTGKITHAKNPDKIWYAGGRLSYALGVGIHTGKYETDRGQYDEFREVSYASGCSMLIPRAVIKQMGLFKPGIFMYLDDAEFCLRIKKNKQKIYYEPRSVLLHDLPLDFGSLDYPPHYLYFSIRNKPLISANPLYISYLHFYNLLQTAVKWLKYLIHPAVKNKRQKLGAIFWGWLDSFSSLPLYKKRFPSLFN